MFFSRIFEENEALLQGDFMSALIFLVQVLYFSNNLWVSADNIHINLKVDVWKKIRL